MKTRTSKQTIFLSVILLLVAGCENLVSPDTSAPLQENRPLTRATTSTFTESTTFYNGHTFFLPGAEGTISGARSDNGNKKLTRTFTVQAPSTDNLYLGAHAMACCIDDEGTLQKIEVWVNDEYAGELDIRKPEWDFVSLKGQKTIQLLPGNNKIAFLSDPPYYPEVDALQIEPDMNMLMKQDPQYDAFISYLKQQKTLPSQKLEQEDILQITSQNERPETGIPAIPGTKSAYDPSWNWQVTPYTLNNPDGNYPHLICVPVTYTYHRKLSLSAGTYTFMTSPIDGDDYYAVDPVMYLYKVDAPHTHSYYNDDASGMGYHSKITATLPAGEYYLVVRAYSSHYASSTTGRQGLVNVYQNGFLLNSQTPVAGYMVNVDSPNTGVLNFFTAYTTGIAEFFLEERSTHKMKFFGSTYFYIPPMEQMWMQDARMRLTKPSSTIRYNMLITSIGAFGAYYGNCDVYGSCQQVQPGEPAALGFPNLQLNDAIYASANPTAIYNCASWAGGLTYGWTWEGITQNQSSPTPVGPNYGSPSVWSTWDAFFANNPPRYAGATVYTRDDANAANGEIAVWSKNGDISGVTHFSCRGTANGHPHGYTWESKPGQQRRIFHPRDALWDTNPKNIYRYGTIFAYYRDASKPAEPSVPEKRKFAPSLTFDESLRRGLTVIEKVELSAEEAKTLSRKQTLASKKEISEIQKLYDIWGETISSKYSHISDPYVLMDIPEGIQLIEYCRERQPEALAFFGNLFFDDKNESMPKAVAHYMLCVIFSDYAEDMETIKDDWSRNQYDTKGAYVAPLPEMFVKKFTKKLITKL